MKKSTTKEFDAAYEEFARGKGPISHQKAIEMLLSQFGLEEEFGQALREEDRIRDFFLLWERAGREEEDPKERAGLKKLGEMSKKLYETGEYRALSELFYDVVFRNLADFLRLQERNDFEELTDHDLYTKNLLPPEIFLQFFLLESLVKRDDFDWNRGNQIAHQNLACLIICFEDIYEFFHEEEGEQVTE